MRVSINLQITKKLLVTVLLVIIIGCVSTFVLIKRFHDNPLPASVKTQITFRVVYPPKHLAPTEAASYSYINSSNVLTFQAKFDDAIVTFSEQPAPSSLGTDTQVYYPALGIHPYAQFKTRLGTVALTKFWQSGNLQPVGQAAVMVSHGTLTIAHTDKSLTNQQWKELFDNLKTAR